MNIGQLIHERRIQLGLTLEEVGNKVGVNKSTVKKWETGNISNMRRDKIALLAKVLKISPVQLIEEKSDCIQTSESVITDNIFMRPVYDSVAAGFNALAQDNIIEYIPTYIQSEAEQEEYIWINVKGDSMSPLIDNGDQVLVRRQTSVDSGQIAIVIIDGEEAVIKKVIYGSSWIELISINPYYPPRRFEGENVQRVFVFGLVKKVNKTIA